MEASFNLFYTGLYGNSNTSINKGILPSRTLSQIPEQKILPQQVDQPNSSPVKFVDDTPMTVDVSWLDTYSFITRLSMCLQCFDTVGWAAGRASGL